MSTAAAFGALDPAAFEPCRRPGLPVRASVVQFGVWLNESRNDLEAPATTLAPAIGAALDAPRNEEGCVLARMSGSGATCFGLFMDETRRDRAAARLAAAWPRWWVAATTA